MNELEQVIKLIEAGYTKAEIAAMMAPKAPEEQQQPEETTQSQQSEQVPDVFTSKIDEAISKLEKLGDNMAKLAIMTSEQPPRQDLDDYLASIIDPTFKGKE